MKAHFAEVHCFFVSSRKQHNPLFLKTKKAVKKDALDICSSQLIFYNCYCRCIIQKSCYNIYRVTVQIGVMSMGIYVNPDNRRFLQAVHSEIYIDKSRLISVTNKKLNTEQKCICVSRPRRFGKSINLAMLAAYYSKGCSSAEIFDKLAISRYQSYAEYLNQYNVIYINMQDFLSRSRDIDNMLQRLEKRLFKEFLEEHPGIDLDPDDGLTFWMEDFYKATEKKPFVILIDEWDCVMREHRNNKEALEIYLDFLRNWLKDKEYIALAYMTGILPIKKYGTHSALNMFDEYSMLSSKGIEKYIGFTDKEVAKLCRKYRINFDDMKLWYNGYKLNGTDLYCPRSVVKAVTEKHFGGYWTETETYEALAKYIAMNFDGLHDTIEKLLADQPQPTDTRTFSNDMITFTNKDDILTLLVHLGYLGYIPDKRTVYIPNKEIADEFVVSMKATGLWRETIETVMKSKQLLADTLQGNSDIVAQEIERVHDSNSSTLNYNNEQSLRFIILIAYYYAKEQYEIIQELPTGKGFADIVFIPKHNVDAAVYPPMVIELKWDENAQTAIQQIKDRNYPEKLKSFEKVLLVGISYTKNIKHNKKHQCIIEEYQMK